MSALSISTSNFGKELFHILPHDPIFAHLRGADYLIPKPGSTVIDERPLVDDEDLKFFVKMAQVCKTWGNNPAYREERAWAIKLYEQRIVSCLADYPEEILNLFKYNGISIYHLPKLDATTTNVFDLRPKQMYSSIMRFEIKNQDQHYNGIAFKINIEPSAIRQWQLNHIPIQEYQTFITNTVLAVFKISRDRSSKWRPNEWSGTFTIPYPKGCTAKTHWFFDEKQKIVLDQECISLISNLLQGTDPEVFIVDDTPVPQAESVERKEDEADDIS